MAHRVAELKRHPPFLAHKRETLPASLSLGQQCASNEPLLVFLSLTDVLSFLFPSSCGHLPCILRFWLPSKVAAVNALGFGPYGPASAAVVTPDEPAEEGESGEIVFPSNMLKKPSEQVQPESRENGRVVSPKLKLMTTGRKRIFQKS